MTALCGWAGLTSIQLLTYSNQEPTGSVAHGIRQPPQCRALLQRNVRMTMHQLSKSSTQQLSPKKA